jgi:phage terminase small subunit
MNTFNTKELKAYVENKKLHLIQERFNDIKQLIQKLTKDVKALCEKHEKNEADDLLSNI